MCFPGRGTHFTRDMCFPGRGSHITRDMCFPGRGTHNYHYGYVFRRKGNTHQSMDMRLQGRGAYITRDECFPGREHISLGICVSQEGEHTSVDGYTFPRKGNKYH